MVYALSVSFFSLEIHFSFDSRALGYVIYWLEWASQRVLMILVNVYYWNVSELNICFIYLISFFVSN